MTTPYERTRSTLLTREFLSDLAAGRWPVPPDVQNQARRLLRHYPEQWHVERAHEALPDWWGPLKDPTGTR